MDRDWRVKTTSLGESLGHIFETGLYSDVAFLVGEDEFRINAHKTILSARSEPMAAMLHERWNPEMTEEIKMPRNNKTAFKPFLKFLYTDAISFREMELEDMLEITHLAQMYQVHKLLEECITNLNCIIDESNCLQIHKSCGILDKKLSDAALKFFLKNVVPKAKYDNTYLTWDSDTIQKILLDDREYVPEKALFKALLKWRDEDVSRNDDSKKLLLLIRFPTMSMEDLVNEVVPTGEVSRDEMLEMFSKNVSKFPTKERKSMFIRKAVICKSFGNVDWESLLPMFRSFCFNRFRLTINAEIPFVTLFGMKYFCSGVPGLDVTRMLEYLKQARCTIVVYLLNEYSGEQLGRISKTIDELQQNNLRIYFDTPITLFTGTPYSFTTEVDLLEGEIPHPPANCVFPMNKLVKKAAFKLDGSGYKLTFKNLQGEYCITHELIFASREKFMDNCNENECVIS